MPEAKPARSSRVRPNSSIPDILDGEARYRLLADQTHDAVFLSDAVVTRITDVNVGASILTGYERSELVGALISKLVSPGDRAAQRDRTASSGVERTLASAARFRRKDGTLIDVEIRQRRLDDGRVLAVVRTVNQGRLAEGQYSRMLTRFELLVATVDKQSRISYANAALSGLTGWSVEELIGRPIADLLPSASAQSESESLSAEFWAGDLEGLITAELVTRTGQTLTVAVSATMLQDQHGTNVGVALMGQDITHDRAAMTELEREIRERAGIATSIARLQPGGSTEAKALAICMELRGLRGVDLALVVSFSKDGQTTVLASDAPEEMRAEISSPAPPARSKYLIERTARGPWVELWKQRVDDADYGASLAESGIQSLSYAPIRYADRTLGLLAVGSLDREKGDDLPIIAEFGPVASALLGPDLHASQLAEELRGRLQEIVRSRAFHPVFQPIVDVETGQVVGYEALTRFADGEPPSARFSAAWSVGSGVELELATLERAIVVGRHLPPGRWLSVNLSPRLLLAHQDEIRVVLGHSNRSMVLEVTEHERISEYIAVREALKQFSPARTAVDDAGAGFTNFAHIVDIRPDFVKVDIGLVRGVDTDLARQAMIVALCHFARNTDCQLIAEGVETIGEAKTLRSLGVAFGQGYWYGRPIEVEFLSATPAKGTAAA